MANAGVRSSSSASRVLRTFIPRDPEVVGVAVVAVGTPFTLVPGYPEVVGVVVVVVTILPFEFSVEVALSDVEFVSVTSTHFIFGQRLEGGG